MDFLIPERCLNHSLGGLVVVYDKHHYITERRNSLELWSAKIAALQKGEGFNIVPFKCAVNDLDEFPTPRISCNSARASSFTSAFPETCGVHRPRIISPAAGST